MLIDSSDHKQTRYGEYRSDLFGSFGASSPLDRTGIHRGRPLQTANEGATTGKTVTIAAVQNVISSNSNLCYFRNQKNCRVSYFSFIFF